MPDQQQHVVTATEAAKRTGFSVRTILQWLAEGKIAGAQKVQPRGLVWRWAIPVDALGELRRSPPASSSEADGDEVLAARLAAIERRLAALEARSAGRQVALPDTNGASSVEKARGLPDLLGASGGHIARQPVKTRPIITDMGALAGLQHLPGGLVGDRVFARRHGIPLPTLHDALTKPDHENHIPPAPGGPWVAPDGQTVRYALDARGQARAYQHYVKGHSDRERSCCPHEVGGAV